ncbi:glycosyl transferase, partial [Protofrankia coriariae]
MAVTATYPTVDGGEPRTTVVTKSNRDGLSPRERLAPP